MPKANNDYKKNVTKQFWKYLSTERLRPSTKMELRQVYYGQFKKSLDRSSPTVSFSTILFQLKRMKKLVKCKDGSDTLLYFERKGRRLVLAVDQSFVQRKQRNAAKEKGEDDEKDVDETEREEHWGQEDDDPVLELKKLFLKHKYVALHWLIYNCSENIQYLNAVYIIYMYVM